MAKYFKMEPTWLQEFEKEAHYTMSILDKIHPVRALLAVGVWAIVGALVLNGMTVPDGLWVSAGAITTFYFTDVGGG